MSTYLPDDCTQDMIDRAVNGPEPEPKEPKLLAGPEMSFTVERWGKNDYTVRMGDRFQGGLCFDECLGIAAALILNGEKIHPERWLRTPQEQQEERERIFRPLTPCDHEKWPGDPHHCQEPGCPNYTPF